MRRTATLLQKHLAKGQFKLSIHAAKRMQERYISKADIMSCGKTAKTYVFQEESQTWKVVGKDVDGFLLTVICSFRDGIMIVTVF